MGIKQIDAADLCSKGLILWEVKSCVLSEYRALQRAMCSTQRRKWKKTTLILSELLQMKIVVRVVVIKYQNGFNFVKNHKLV